jgi:hypothetical protein
MMVNLHRVMRGLKEINAKVAVSKLTQMHIKDIRDVERHVVEQLSVGLSRHIYEDKVEMKITKENDFGQDLAIYRINLWVLSDEELERVANESYLQGVIDGRREADLLNKGRGEEGLGVSSSIEELAAKHTKAPEGEQP